MTRSEKLERIAVLWAENLSTTLIGKRLGVTKNMVCGEVSRARQRGDLRFSARKLSAILRTIRKDARRSHRLSGCREQSRG